jgi:hypothetical protein
MGFPTEGASDFSHRRSDQLWGPPNLQAVGSGDYIPLDREVGAWSSPLTCAKFKVTSGP